MKATFQLALLFYQCAAGLCDTSTGLLLLLAPAWTLHLMGITLIPVPAVFASFIGVFVMAVGVTYLWTATQWTTQDALGRRTQWLITALIRTLVSLFVLGQIVAGRMEPAWMTVAISDGVLAAVQWLGLSRGWLHFAERQ